MKIKKIFISLAISLIFSSSFSQTDSIPLSTSYNLSDCIKMGIKRNYDILIVRQKQQISDNNYTLGNAGFLPSANFLLSNPNSINNDMMLKTNNSSNQLSPSVNIEWPIFQGFLAKATYQRLEELKTLGELETRQTIENLISETASIYYQIVRQNIRYDNLKNLITLSQERLNIVEARYELGTASKLELQQALVDYNADNTLLIKQEELIFNYLIELNQLISTENIEQKIDIKDNTIDLIPIGTKTELWQKIETSNSAIIVSERNFALSEADLRIAKSRKYPYFTLNTGYNYDQIWNNQTLQTQQQGLNLGLSIGMNLFDGLNQRREENNAEIQLNISELNKKSLEQTIRADFAKLWTAYTTNKSIILLEEINVETAQEYFDIAMDRYKLGELSGIELREAQNSLLESVERLSIAQFNTKICEISLVLLSGEILNFYIE